MKRPIAVLLALLMLLTFAAGCKKNASDNPPADSQSPSSGDSTPSAATSNAHAGAVGFYSDDANWYDREPYKIAYLSYHFLILHELLSQAFDEWGDRVNFDYAAYDAGGDMNSFLSTMESYASMGYDGFLLDPDAVVSVRTMEYAEELGIPFLPVLVPFMDNAGEHRIAPGVNLDGYNLGGRQTDWLVEHYTEFWPDVKPEEIGYLFLFASFNENLIFNMEGARDRFQALWPDTFATNFFEGDMLAYEVNAAAGFEYTSTFITSHPEIKYWFISTCLEDYAQGATRAAEDLAIDSNVLILSNGVNTVMQDWDNGYDGCWVAGVYYAQAMFAEPLVCGLIALIEGRATFETLWGDYKPAGEKYSVYPIDTRIVTKDSYQDYLDEIARYLA